jgi:hypothetical protein
VFQQYGFCFKKRDKERLESKRFTCLVVINCELDECGANVCLRHNSSSKNAAIQEKVLFLCVIHGVTS